MGTDSNDYSIKVIFLTESVNIANFLSKVELSAVLLSQVYVLLNFFSRDTESGIFRRTKGGDFTGKDSGKYLGKAGKPLL